MVWDISGRRHLKPQLATVCSGLLMFSRVFEMNGALLLTRPAFVQVLNTVRSSLLEQGMNGSIILGAGSSNGSRGCP